MTISRSIGSSGDPRIWSRDNREEKIFFGFSLFAAQENPLKAGFGANGKERSEPGCWQYRPFRGTQIPKLP